MKISPDSPGIPLVTATEQKYGKVSVLGNITGMSGRPAGMTVQVGNITGTAPAEQTPQSWNRIMEVNATGTFPGNESGKARMDATPLGRFGKPIDIAMGCLCPVSCVRWVVSWVTGSELVIDGGMTAN